MKEEPLYKEDKLKSAGEEITAMARRFGVTKEDVIYASWIISKGMVWAKLKRDLADKEKE